MTVEEFVALVIVAVASTFGVLAGLIWFLSETAKGM